MWKCCGQTDYRALVIRAHWANFKQSSGRKLKKIHLYDTSLQNPPHSARKRTIHLQYPPHDNSYHSQPHRQQRKHDHRMQASQPSTIKKVASHIFPSTEKPVHYRGQLRRFKETLTDESLIESMQDPTSTQRKERADM